VKLILPAGLQAHIAAEAKAAFPRECCGLIEGLLSGDFFEAKALHPARNDAQTSDRFDIAPEDHLKASRLARANGHRLIGYYHSHPSGAPRPSQHDVAGAVEENFLWLIAATEGPVIQLGAFVYRSAAFEPVALTTGADLVTSSRNERN
jgi:proteasome lid subunit RPN8/RPN11